MIKALGALINAGDEDLAIRRMAADKLGYCGPRAIEPLSHGGGYGRRCSRGAPRRRDQGPHRYRRTRGGRDPVRLHGGSDAETTAATAAAESCSEPAPAVRHESADTAEAPPETSLDETFAELLRVSTARLHSDLQDPDPLTRE